MVVQKGIYSMIFTIILAIIGFFLSVYAYFIEQKIKIAPGYQPACDISERISCSKPFKSKYAYLFYFSNALVGIVYYPLIVLLAIFKIHYLLLIATFGSCIASCLFAYLLYFRIKTLCVICTSIYIVNILILALALKTFFL